MCASHSQQSVGTFDGLLILPFKELIYYITLPFKVRICSPKRTNKGREKTARFGHGLRTSDGKSGGLAGPQRVTGFPMKPQIFRLKD